MSNNNFWQSLFGNNNSWQNAANATTNVPAGRLGSGNPFDSSNPLSWLGNNALGLGMVGGGIASLFGGNPYKDLAKSYSGIQPELQQYLQQALGYLQPYQQMGTSAAGSYLNKLNQMQDPVQFYNNIMSQYQTSPAMKFQQQQGMQALQNNAAATGFTGSGQELKDVLGYSQGLAQQGQNQYLQDVLGINQSDLSGLSNLAGMGEQASGQMGAWTQSTGDEIASLMSQIAQAQAQAKASKGSAIGDIIGGVASLF